MKKSKKPHLTLVAENRSGAAKKEKRKKLTPIGSAFGIDGVPINRMIPNMVTMMAMASGISAIRLAALERFGTAVIFILLAAVFDGLDGRVARMLNGTSKFGEEMDSLSDFVSFGVAPAFLMYCFSVHQIPAFGWVICLFCAIACGLRLARFNTMIDAKPLPGYWQNFFMGLPAPGGGLVTMLPIIFYMAMQGQSKIWASPYVGAGFVVFSGIMMISRFPTLSLKKMKVPSGLVIPVFLLTAVLASLIITKLWIGLSILGLIYLMTIPVCFAAFIKLRKKAK